MYLIFKIYILKYIHFKPLLTELFRDNIILYIKTLIMTKTVDRLKQFLIEIKPFCN